MFVTTTGKSPPNFSSPVLARPSFPSLWCSRASEFLLSNRCFYTPDFPFSPSCSRAPKFSFPLVFSRARISPFKLLFSRDRFSSFPFAVFSCTLFASFLVKFLGDRLSSFSLSVFALLSSHFSCVLTPALISPLLLVFPRAWVSLPRDVPLCPNLSFTVSIPARRIYPFSVRVLARPNFSFPLGVLAGLIVPFLLLFSCARYFPSSFSALFFRAFSRSRLSSFSDACHAYFAVYKC